MAARVRETAGVAAGVIAGVMAAYVTGLLACYFFAAFGIRRHHLESACFIFVTLLLVRLWLLPAGPARSTATRVARVAGLMALLAAVVYSRALTIGLLSDDYVLQSWVLEGHQPWAGSQFARPVALALWRRILLLGGGPPALHFLNVALHATNAVLVTCLAARLGLRRPGVVGAALVFVLWPTQVEPVVWASGIFDVLAATWVLLAVLLCLREKPLLSNALDVTLAVALAALALFTKESAVALPVLALVAVAPGWARARAWQRRDGTLVAVLVAATAAYLLWRLSAGLPVAGTPAFSRYVLKEQLSRTFATLATPLSTENISAHPIVACLFTALVIVIAAVSALSSERRGSGHIVAIQGLFWSVIAAAPTVGFLLIGSYLEGSRYLYLPALGWGLTLGGLLDSSNHERARLAVTVVLAGLIACAALQQHQSVSEWRAAARARDQMLAQAVGLATTARCEDVTVKQLPPTFKGAQLFNNGFAEALRGARVQPRGSRHCQWTWTGAAFRED